MAKHLVGWALVIAAACGGDDGGTSPPPCTGPGITGTITDDAGAPIAEARVTAVDAGGGVTAARTDAAGRYTLQVGAGTVTLGASALDRGYVERAITVAASACTTADLALAAETEPGRWEDRGDPGKAFGGTNSAVLLPDGRIMMCHDTLDPVILDPVSGDAAFPPASPRLQGCHAVTVLPDGRVLYAGGADQPVYGPGTRQVKTYDPRTDRWTVQPDLITERWYPTLVPLADGRLLAIGGGTLNNPERSRTSETMDPATLRWTAAGDIALGNEVSPIVLLYSGQVLMTHRPPQLFDPATRAWRSTADFVQGNRMPNGDHSDHELQLLPDGRVAAIGFKSFAAGAGQMLEIYDPATERWTLGAEVRPVRSRASTILGADGRVLVIGGFKQEVDPAPTNLWGQTSLVDQWDPRRDAWRRLADIGVAREYHAMPVLVPDGRIFVTGGEGEPGNEPGASRTEAFTPPYLLRGPRPDIAAIDRTDLTRGADVVIDLRDDERITGVVMMGTNATTHFMDSGNGRYLQLAHTQAGARVTARVPDAAASAVPGWYLLFVLVDDIPSVARIVRVTG